jgi:uncharacterized membrane protein YkoI
MLVKLKEILNKRKKLLLGFSGFMLILILGVTSYYSFQKLTEISREEVIQMISDETNSEVLSFDRDWEWNEKSPNRIEMLVKSSHGYEELKLDATTGEIIERSLTSDFQNAENGETLITPEEAIKIAIKEVNGNVEEIELEKDNGILIYDLEINNQKKEYTVNIKANSGSIVKVERS